MAMGHAARYGVRLLGVNVSGGLASLGPAPRCLAGRGPRTGVHPVPTTQTGRWNHTSRTIQRQLVATRQEADDATEVGPLRKP